MGGKLGQCSGIQNTFFLQILDFDLVYIGWVLVVDGRVVGGWWDERGGDGAEGVGNIICGEGGDWSSDGADIEEVGEKMVGLVEVEGEEDGCRRRRDGASWFGGLGENWEPMEGGEPSIEGEEENLV